MADEADTAAPRVEAFQAEALRAALSRPELPPSNGTCRECGNPVESDRLATVPHAIHCAECAKEIEEEAARRQRRGPR